VYFDDIQLYATRCALVERSEYFTKLDYAPGGVPGGDCVIDYQELDEMGNAWLDTDFLIATKNPGDTNLVVYFPLNEGDGNKVYSHPDLDTPDYCDTKFTGTFWNSAKSGYFSTAWGGPGAPVSVGNCVYMHGDQGARVQCGTTYGNLALGIGTHPELGDVNAITVSAWVKSLGPRSWDSYLLSKYMGIMGKRSGWSKQGVIWIFSITPSAQAFDFTSYDGGVYSDSVLPPYWGQWIHLAATYPHPAPDPVEDPNAHARIYLNGGQVNSGPYHFTNGYDANISLVIGEDIDQNEWPDAPESFYGYIDEARIYNRALEPNEIAYLANSDPCSPELWVPIPSPSNVYDANEIYPYVGEQPKGKRVVNFKDFAVVFNRWLTEEMFPPSHR
jgi:hypothetical protein